MQSDFKVTKYTSALFYFKLDHPRLVDTFEI